LAKSLWSGTRIRGHSALRSASLALAASALVVLVAVGSNRSVARVGGSSEAVQWPNLAGDLFAVVMAVCLALAALLVYVLWLGGRRRAKDDQVRRFPSAPWIEQVLAGLFLLALTGGVITAFVFLTRHNGSLGPDQPLPLGPGDTDSGPLTGGEGAGDTFVVHWWVLAGLGLVALEVVAVLLAGRRRVATAENAEGREPKAEGRERMREAVEDSLDEIARETDPRRAIIRAYVRMERILARNGLGRLSHEAPVEYLDRALAGIRLSRPAAERLTTLFVRARFSNHDMDPGLKDDAVAALTAMRDELEVAGP
jgi:hypothetical protein